MKKKRGGKFWYHCSWFSLFRVFCLVEFGLFVSLFLIQFCSFLSGRELKYVSPEGFCYFFEWLNYYSSSYYYSYYYCWWYGIVRRLFCYLNFDQSINILMKSCKLFLDLHHHFLVLVLFSNFLAESCFNKKRWELVQEESVSGWNKNALVYTIAKWYGSPAILSPAKNCTDT